VFRYGTRGKRDPGRLTDVHSVRDNPLALLLQSRKRSRNGSAGGFRAYLP
jgi:hypothetical protein